MVAIKVCPDSDLPLWHFNFDDGKYGCEITEDAFRGLICQLMESSLYWRPTEMICDADDIEADDETE